MLNVDVVYLQYMVHMHVDIDIERRKGFDRECEIVGENQWEASIIGISICASTHPSVSACLSLCMTLKLAIYLSVGLGDSLDLKSNMLADSNGNTTATVVAVVEMLV
ncbi:hypothetical protein LOAG_01565 [Loa loa]|uniref:Uncharacterized protein n=1 Tax=Loa loa TaxID=7209 RepID=A0A1S0U926_LOALO|nr:hypothetical protein LOAG_01565 [Loa loa]EFO26912.1 hypothetical protein LOAG_01565 [Loa loa]